MDETLTGPTTGLEQFVEWEDGTMRNKELQGLGGLLVILVVVAVIQPTRLEIMLPNGMEASIIKDNQITVGALLDSLYKNSRDELTGWLANKSIFHIQDAELGTALTSALCDSIPERPLDQMLEAANLCAAKPVAARLRTLAQWDSIPFHPVGEEVLVGFPGSLESGAANVCPGSRFRDREIEISTQWADTTIVVHATGLILPCSITPGIPFPDIQISMADAVYIFGENRRKLEVATAIIRD